MPKSTSWANRLDLCQLFGLPTTPVAPVSSLEESSRRLTRTVSAFDADGLSTQAPTLGGRPTADSISNSLCPMPSEGWPPGTFWPAVFSLRGPYSRRAAAREVACLHPHHAALCPSQGPRHACC